MSSPPPSGTVPTPGATQLPGQGGAPSVPSPQTTPSPQANTAPVAPGQQAPASPPVQTPPLPPPPVTSPWSAAGIIDVQPLQLYEVSAALAFEQGSFHKTLIQLLDAHAGYARVGGSGSAAVEFATEYAKVVALLLDVHARAVLAIGGAAIGFTTTANNFGLADASTHPGGPPFTPQGPPVVIWLKPTYTPPPPFGVRDGNAVDDFLDVIDGGIAGDLMREVVEAALRTGRALEILPLPNYLRVNEVSQLWLGHQMGIGTIEGQLLTTVDTITDHTNADWHAAMRQFVSSLWGTTAWGKRTADYEWAHKPPTGPGTSLPVFGVLSTTAEKLAEVTRIYAEAAQRVRADLRGILHRAFKEALVVLDVTDIKGSIKHLFDRLKKLSKGLLAAVLLNIDTGAVNRAVDTYEEQLRAQAGTLRGLIPALEEAARAVPTFQAEEARAEAYGARSLFEFNRKIYPVNPDAWNPANHFQVDLAAMEWERNDYQPNPQAPVVPGLEAHTVDKHVGLTPEQLTHRLRDQGTDPASTFRDLPSAQEYVNAAVNDPAKKDMLDNWIRRQEQKVLNGTFNPESTQNWDFPVKDANGQAVEVGTSVSQADFAAQGYAATGTPVHTVHVSLAYSPETKSLYVLTAYPKAP
ncbi:RNase A-like domain-containing protein [Streptomyces sp. NPDC054835]|uniref:RNase A-like domain-containing protein n=1 Tax=Streptomyces sp. NBC_01268 TaxID=2903806 RepID=UPI002E3642C5|nr:RNase A-like domain-containing protein [Streptomyces sp. NBC_01268]